MPQIYRWCASQRSGRRAHHRAEGRVWGRGPPVRVLQGSRVRDMVDGAGLCSPGRWKPGARKLPEVSRLASDLGEILAATGIDWRRTMFALACGKVGECPFPLDAIRKGRVAVQRWASERGFPVNDHANDVDQPVRIRLLQAFLRAAGDPDAPALDAYAQGVRLGVGFRMQRTPAVFEEHQRWRLEFGRMRLPKLGPRITPPQPRSQKFWRRSSGRPGTPAG